MESQITREYIKVNPKTRFNQGDILRDIEIPVVEDFNAEDGYVVVGINLEYGVIINQECDLEHDFNTRAGAAGNQDKFLPNILIVPAYLAVKLKEGTHRGDEMKCETWNSARWNPITQNQNIRFHYISENTANQIPQLVIDFKHVYTINRDLLYKKKEDVYLASMGELFRENLSQRYCHYLSRIGLPIINT